MAAQVHDAGNPYGDPDWAQVPAIDLDRVRGVLEQGISGWQPPGPVAYDFLTSEKFVRLIAGPYGSGKTGALVIDPFVKAARQPRCRDGIRRHKHVFVRDTFPNLYANFVETYDEWVLRDLGVWRGGENRPFRHDLRLVDEHGVIELSIEGTAIGERDPEKVLDGYQPTGVGLNAISGLPEAVLEYFIGRMGRFPPKRMLPEGVEAWTGISGDFNKTDVDHWLYDWCVTRRTELEAGGLFAFFDQPGGMSPGAENRDNLQPDYYDRMIATWPQWKIDRLVHNKWGADRSGTPVYDAYDDQLHVAPAPLQPIDGVDIGIGFDGGMTLHPAAVFGQQDSEGQWRILAEIYAGRMGASRFSELVLDFIAKNYSRHRFYGFCDPTADRGADKEGGEKSWLDTLQFALGIPILPAGSNEEALRIDAVDQVLRSKVHGNRPGFIMDPQKCPTLRKGFNSSYMYRNAKVAGEDSTERHPAKNSYSHPHDALQYLILGKEGVHAVVTRRGGNLPFAGHDPAAGLLGGKADWGWSPLS
tara:strand:- start:3882 stop:5468 length:1587 start_codon:yes stop_codon:yes gene_type:complete